MGTQSFISLCILVGIMTTGLTILMCMAECNFRRNRKAEREAEMRQLAEKEKNEG